MLKTPSRPKLKTAFRNVRTIAPLHTAGPVAVTPDGTKIITCVAEEALMTDVLNGTTLCRFAGDTQPITALCISPSCQHLLLFGASLSLRVYQIPASFAVPSQTIQPVRIVARAHDAPVHVCKADPTSTYLASGSADGVVKVWDISRGYVTHVFKGHGGVVSALTFNYPLDPSSIIREKKMQLITASVDTHIRIFELSATTSRNGGSLKPQAILEGHVSVPRGLDVTEDGKWLISAGRDSVVLIWELFSKQGADSAKRSKGSRKQANSNVVLAKTITTLERVEAVGFIHLPPGSSGPAPGPARLHFFTGGAKGVLKVWDGRAGVVLFQIGQEQTDISDEDEEQRQIVDAIYLPSSNTIISVHADQNILFHSLTTKSMVRQLIGFNDEIVDAIFLSPISLSTPQKTDTHIALATNSSLIRLYSTSSLDARLLAGHKDIVLCLDAGFKGQILASGSKDRSARLWAARKPSLDGSYDWGWRCIGICEGHTASIGAIAMSSRTSSLNEEAGLHRFMFTGSQDRTIKMWDLSALSPTHADQEEALTRCRSLVTYKAHEKDINALDVSPNDRLLASGSQDRTVKIYEIEYHATTGGRSALGELKLIGTCKGHKRGVWSVRFSRAERVLATGSGDKTVKLWNLEDFSCVKTIEGHMNSVLRVDFLNDGMQMVSAASDGLVKLWNVQNEECIATMDNHQDRVWALAISSDERTIVSGAADSVVTFWEDCTEEQEQEKEAKRADMVLKEQDFVNYISLRNYRKAIELALVMGQPGRLFKLFKDIRAHSEPSITGNASVDEVLRTLSGSDLARILRYVRDWNANAKTSEVAQRVLHAVFKLRTAEDVIGAFELDTMLVANTSPNTQDGTRQFSGDAGSMTLKDIVEALTPYTERHLARMERLVQDSYVVDYILGEMDDGMLDGVQRSDEAIMDVDMHMGVTVVT